MTEFIKMQGPKQMKYEEILYFLNFDPIKIHEQQKKSSFLHCFNYGIYNRH